MAKETDLIKDKIDVVEFIRSYLPLIPAGKNFKALCPFHQEKTPSFIVSPERKSWHCFGCNEGGDVISFLMKYENLEFPEALRVLAERAGIQLERINPREQREFGVLLDIHDAAEKFFNDSLMKNQSALRYLNERGLKKETIDEFKLGFAAGGETLTLNLLKLGYDVEDIVRAGLSHKNTSGLYRDRFQNRAIFPILNSVGKTVAFTGRLLPPEDKDSQYPKYLNSPETPIFNKSKILYGFYNSKNDIAKSRTAVLVEGQMDYLMLWQTGVRNAVAVSGTALTAQHLERLRRIADTLVVNFDADRAGLQALDRALELFNKFDFHVRAAKLDKFKDAAEAALGDPDYLKAQIESAEPAYRFLFEAAFAPMVSGSGIADKKRTVRHFLQMIRNLGSSVEQNEWMKELAKRSGISELALLSESANIPAKEETAKETEANAKSVPFRRLDIIAPRLVTLAFTKEKFWDIITAQKEKFPKDYDVILNDPKSEQARFFEMQAALCSSLPEAKVEEEFNELLRELEIEFLKGKQESLKHRMREVGDKGDDGAVDGILGDYHNLAKRIDELKNKR